MTDSLRANGYQFLSRKNIRTRLIREFQTSPKERPDIAFQVECRLVPAPFSTVNLEEDPRRRPRMSIGPYQGIDQNLEKWNLQKWPMCVHISASITCSGSLRDNDTLVNSLFHMRTLLDYFKSEELADELRDQLTTVRGYQRTYVASQMYDFEGKRRPSHSVKYTLAEAGSFAGPGMATVDVSYPQPNELGWGRVIPFAMATAVDTDLQEIQTREQEVRLHSNSNEELVTAAKHLEVDDVKGCIRSAAAAVESRLRYSCKVWGVALPKGQLQFDQRIDQALASASKPAYRAIDPDGLERVLYLYRARNSMHEGDCFYKDSSGVQREVRRKEQARPLYDAALAFCVWLDSIV